MSTARETLRYLLTGAGDARGLEMADARRTGGSVG
jgi:hypothetical protein